MGGDAALPKLLWNFLLILAYRPGGVMDVRLRGDGFDSLQFRRASSSHTCLCHQTAWIDSGRTAVLPSLRLGR